MKTKFLNYFFQWEYWPSYMFYVPLLPYALYLALKARSFGFFSTVNPGIEGSGNGLESKYKTTLIIPDEFKPKTIFIPINEPNIKVYSKLEEAQIKFPLIIKPDIGFRGLLVKKINSKEELNSYLLKYNSINLIIQEFIELKNECGLFYYKIPGEKSGIISSLTLKKYLSVIGDGKSSLKFLIIQNSRAKKYLAYILELNKEKLNTILPINQEYVLNLIGNHSKGTQFINGNHLINENLLKTINDINARINGWNYGRLDIKYNTLEELIQGKNIKILEINGIIAEPTHIYDSLNGNYFNALLSIKNHWTLIYKIGVKNKKNNCLKYSTLIDFLQTIKQLHNYNRLIKRLSS